MAALAAGLPAPGFTLARLDGGSFSLASARSQAVVLAFFKTSCPVCQFTFPYLARLAQRVPAVPVFGISQDTAGAASEFVRRTGAAFPILLDPPGTYLARRAYGLTHVPSIFAVDPDGIIRLVLQGFDRDGMERLLLWASRQAGAANPAPLFTAADGVPALRPG
ncbi:MAG TPA: TlpA disulfide reductase family protein [Terriglobales bacterium]|nr:TlpA disulfide reductase family protein [Terriglobales bacterium]